MSDGSDLERRRADLEELLARERVARKLAQDEARANSIALRVLAREVRAPLDGVLDWARMLQRELLSKSGRDHALRVIERQVEGSLRLIDELVVHAASAPPRPAPLSLDQIVRAVNADLAPRLEERKLSCVTELAAVTIHADAKRTERFVRRFVDTTIALATEGTEFRLALTQHGLSSTFEPAVELPSLPVGSWDDVSAPFGIPQPHLVHLFLLQHFAAARGARLELQREGGKATLYLVLVQGQSEDTVPFSDHELRSPLQILTVGVELLRTRVRDSADDLSRAWLLERFDALEQAVEHLTAAMDRLSGAHAAPAQSPPSAPRP